MTKVALLIGVSSALVAASVHAAPVTVYSQNFDGLTAGAKLSGQGTPAFLTLADDGDENDLAGTVKSSIGVGGSQAFAIDTAPMTDNNFWWQEPGSVSLAGKIVRLSYAFDLNPPTVAQTVRSSFSVGLYNPAGARITGVGITTTGNISYTNAAGVGMTYTLPTPITSAQGFNLIGLTIDFSLAVPTGTITYNGAVLPITAGVVLTSGTTLNDTDIVASPTGYDIGVFDNLLVTTEAVPEPTSLCVLGAAGVLLRRRR